jgi:dUTPase
MVADLMQWLFVVGREGEIDEDYRNHGWFVFVLLINNN